MNIKTIALIGGTGKSGRYVLRELLRHHFTIKLLTRNKDFIIPDNQSSLKVTTGDARNERKINELLSDCQAVISTIGQPKSEPSIFSQSTGNILSAMTKHKISRYIVTTGLSVNTSEDKKNDYAKNATLWMYENFPETTHDKQKEYLLLKESHVNWTLVRLPMILMKDQPGKAQVDLLDCKGEYIYGNQLAEFIVEELKGNTYFRQAPFLYSGSN